MACRGRTIRPSFALALGVLLDFLVPLLYPAVQHITVALVAEDRQAFGGGVPDHLALVAEQGDQDGLQLCEGPEGAEPSVSGCNSLATCCTACSAEVSLLLKYWLMTLCNLLPLAKKKAVSFRA